MANAYGAAAQAENLVNPVQLATELRESINAPPLHHPRRLAARFNMTDKQSLDEITGLLLKYPGITSAVVFRTSDRPHVHVRFRCIDAASLKAIASCAAWANVTIVLSDPSSSICAEKEDSWDLPCDITIPDVETDLPTQPQQFGVWLARDLRHQGLISSEECQRLHSRWNARLANPKKS